MCSELSANKFKVTTRSSGYFWVDWPQSWNLWSQWSIEQVQGHQDIYYWIGLKLRTCDRVWGPNKFKVIPMSFRHLLLDWFQTSYMLSKLTAKHVQGHLNVIWAFITGLASNLVHAIAIEGRTRSMSSQGHLGIYYWIGFKLSTCYHNWQPNMYKVISRSF